MGIQDMSMKYVSQWAAAVNADQGAWVEWPKASSPKSIRFYLHSLYPNRQYEIRATGRTTKTGRRYYEVMNLTPQFESSREPARFPQMTPNTKPLAAWKVNIAILDGGEAGRVFEVNDTTMNITVQHTNLGDALVEYGIHLTRATTTNWHVEDVVTTKDDILAILGQPS